MGSDDRRLRAGFVGAGHMGQYHLLAYAELWDIELAAVVDSDRERAAHVAAYYDTRPLVDHRDLIGVIDLASVAVPTEQHLPVASDILEAVSIVSDDFPMPAVRFVYCSHVIISIIIATMMN